MGEAADEKEAEELMERLDPELVLGMFVEEGEWPSMIKVRVKLSSIPPAHRKRRAALPQTPQEERGPRKVARGHLSSVPHDSGLREVLERKMEQLKEVEGFLAEGLELGLLKYTEELKKDIEALRRRLGE